MNQRLNSFAKIVILMVGLLLIMMLCFAVYNQRTVQVMKQEIESASSNKLTFFRDQLQERINQIAINTISLANDPGIRELDFLQQSDDAYNRQKLTHMILDTISLQSGITGWRTDITVYFRTANEVVSTSSKLFDFDDRELLDSIKPGWLYKGESPGETPSFVWYSLTPAKAFEQLDMTRLVVKTSFEASYLQTVLDQYKSNSQGDPFLYSPEHGIIGNRSIKQNYVREAEAFLAEALVMDGESNHSIKLSGQHYLLSYLPIQGLNWYLVDALPVEQILKEVTQARNLFYGSSILLLVFCTVALSILYKQLQVPIRELMRNMQRIKRGDYSSRIQIQGGGEFNFLFSRFNDMAEEIQELMETVFAEKIRSREAMLKQLQSQINPHFLYNCLFFIKNMSRLGDEEAVVAMSLNLGEYFRYTTRLGKPDALLQEELDVLVNYLEIQNLRTNRIHYEIEVPEHLRAIAIPRLLLQPIVENAVIHGIEPKEGHGEIRIQAFEEKGFCVITITDNGVGMTEQAMEQLNERLLLADNTENVSFGLWNVHQRLKLKFGSEAGIIVQGSLEQGETTVAVRFPMQKEE